MDFLNEQSTTKNSDGIYRVDLSKCKDKKKGYRSVVRFLPNLTKEGKVAQSAIDKITHYVDIKNPDDQLKECNSSRKSKNVKVF